MTGKVLLVEDCKETQLIVRKILENCEREVHIAGDRESASTLVKVNLYDLILLDIELPDGNGLYLCSELRQNMRTSEVPIIFITGREDISDKVTAFSLGADDYIVKPFNVMEFKARIEAKLKKIEQGKKKESTLSRGPFVFNFSQQKLYLQRDLPATREQVRRDDRPASQYNNDVNEIPLTIREFKLLALLAKNPERVFTRQQILDSVWGQNVHVGDRTIDTFVYNIRKKLSGHGKSIKSVTNIGYMFTSGGS